MACRCVSTRRGDGEVLSQYKPNGKVTCCSYELYVTSEIYSHSPFRQPFWPSSRLGNIAHWYRYIPAISPVAYKGTHEHAQSESRIDATCPLSLSTIGLSTFNAGQQCFIVIVVHERVSYSKLTNRYLKYSKIFLFMESIS